MANCITGHRANCNFHIGRQTSHSHSLHAEILSDRSTKLLNLSGNVAAVF